MVLTGALGCVGSRYLIVQVSPANIHPVAVKMDIEALPVKLDVVTDKERAKFDSYGAKRPHLMTRPLPHIPLDARYPATIGSARIAIPDVCRDLGSLIEICLEPGCGGWEQPNDVEDLLVFNYCG